MDYLYNLYVSFKDGHTQEFEKNSSLSITAPYITHKDRERERESRDFDEINDYDFTALVLLLLLSRRKDAIQLLSRDR